MLGDQRVSVPPQYGIVLYQNYKIPQQRKTLLSHFSAPVVSLTLSNIYTCAVKCHISLDQQCTDKALEPKIDAVEWLLHREHPVNQPDEFRMMI